MIAERTRFTLDELRRLAAETGPARVSIYLPTHQRGREIREDRIRLKNLAREAERVAEQSGEGARVAAILKPLAVLDYDERFWAYQSAGLAVFASPDESEPVLRRLSHPVGELASVGESYVVRPLVSALDDQLGFLLLLLAKNCVRLLDCTRDGYTEIDLEGGPTSLADAVGHDWEEKSLQFHTGTPVTGPGGERPALFHGQGRSGQNPNQELQQFVKRIDTHIQSVINGRRSPMVIAGAERVAAAYRIASEHPDVVEEPVQGNPEHTPLQELHRAALQRVEYRLGAAAGERLGRIREMFDAGAATTSLDEILDAAENSRVATLVVHPREPIWGELANGKADVHDARRPQSVDLLDLAIRRALASGAAILTAQPDAIPSGARVAATMRF